VVLVIHLFGLGDFILSVRSRVNAFSLVLVIGVLDERPKLVGLGVELIQVKFLTVIVVESVNLIELIRVAFLHQDKVYTAAELLGLERDEVVHGLGENDRSLVHVTELINSSDYLSVFGKVKGVDFLLTSDCSFDSRAQVDSEADLDLVLILELEKDPRMPRVGLQVGGSR